MSKASKQGMKRAEPYGKASNQRHKRKADPVPDLDDNDLEAIAEDCDRDMYGDDYDALKYSGWLDR